MTSSPQPYSTPIFRPAARRTASFSSESSFESSFSSNDEFSPYSPNTPLKFKGVPFSWEQIPGIPKHRNSKKKEYSEHILPLPPAGKSNSGEKFHSSNRSSIFRRDPFFAALVECSKDDHDIIGHGTNFGNISSKIARSLSDRFGFVNMYAAASCKRTCVVSEAIVCLPRATPHCHNNLVYRRST